MGAGTVLAIFIIVALVFGWRWHIRELANRDQIKKLAAKAEERAKQLERLGLHVPAVEEAAAGAQVMRLAAPVQGAISPHLPLFPAKSVVEALPGGDGVDNEVANGETILAQFLAAAPAERAAFVYDAERVKPLMKDYYEVQGGTNPVPGPLISKGRYRIDGVEILHFSYGSDRPLGTLEIALRRGGDGKFQLDWESYVGYSEKSFQQLKKERSPNPTLMRVFVRADDFYAEGFADRTKYLSIRLTNDNNTQHIFGYIERDSNLGEWLGEQLDAGAAISPTKGFTLWLSYPQGAQSDQCVLIRQVVASRWLLLPSL